MISKEIYPFIFAIFISIIAKFTPITSEMIIFLSIFIYASLICIYPDKIINYLKLSDEKKDRILFIIPTFTSIMLFIIKSNEELKGTQWTMLDYMSIIIILNCILITYIMPQNPFKMIFISLIIPYFSYMTSLASLMTFTFENMPVFIPLLIGLTNQHILFSVFFDELTWFVHLTKKIR